VDYRMTIRSNPKLLIVPLVIAVLFGLALAGFAASPVLGIGGLAVAAYLTFVLVRFISKQLRCSVNVHEGGVSLDLYGEEKVEVKWSDVSHMGRGRDSRRRGVLFIYREDVDKLLVVPDEFERFDELCAEVGAHGQMMELALAEGETVKDRLRRIVGGPEEDSEEDSEPEATPPPS